MTWGEVVLGLMPFIGIIGMFIVWVVMMVNTK
uniref:Uncharacterized protein n=2 Tax=unclassified bacterial viruses TaxID=12333 RepID=A0AAU6VY38_9VIRU